MKSQWFCVVLISWCSHIAAAEQPFSDPLRNLLISPELLIYHRAEIGLSDEQVEQIRTRVEKLGPQVRGLQQRANNAMGRLAELLSADRVDEEGAAKQLDEFLAIEREQKLLHLRIMIQIRNELTATQRQAALKIGWAPNSNDGLEQRLKAKLAKIEKEMQSRANAGRPPFDAVGLMQKFPVLMQNGQTREAEALLDRVISTLGMEKPVEAESKPANSRKKAQIPADDPQRSAHGLSADEAQDDFYRPDEVQSIRLRVAEEDLQRLLAALPERIYVPASFQWRDITVDKVAVRFKGNSSSHPTQQHKRSFLIKFNEYDEDARFFGLRRVSFDNGVQFGSLFSEPVITEILRDQGLKTQRCNYARIYLNEEYQGVYVNVERIDESFIEHHLPDASGALFKVDEGGPGCNLQFLSDDPSAYKKTFEAKSKSAKKTYDQLVDFIRMINQSEASDFAAQLETKMELDDFLRVTAVMLFSGAFDQLTGWGPHNYYLYHDADRDRWRYLPWDLDVGFCENAFGRVHVLADWNAAWPVAPSGRPNPLMERIVADPALLKRYRQAARTILDEHFEPERLCGIIDAKYALIKEDLQSDPFPHRRVTVPGDRGYDDIVESIKTFVRKRYVSAVEQLENPGPQPKIVHRPAGSQNGGLPPRLAEKLQRIQQRASQMQKVGQDVSPIRSALQRVPPLLQQGKADEAEKVIDEVLKLVGAKPGELKAESPPD